MGKFYGSVGFGLPEQKETSPGVWELCPNERSYPGDIKRLGLRYNYPGKVNTDVSISNRISIVADSYAFDNWMSIKYVVWNGVKWAVVNVTPAPPRLIIDLGDLYVEQEQSY